MDFIHPFTQEVPLAPVLQDNISKLCNDPKAVINTRLRLRQRWKARALELMPASFEVLAQVQDPYLRRLLRGVPDSAVPSLGEFFHIALWRELAEEGKVQDSALLSEMLQGMSIVGPVARSGRWPPSVFLRSACRSRRSTPGHGRSGRRSKVIFSPDLYQLTMTLFGMTRSVMSRKALA